MGSAQFYDNNGELRLDGSLVGGGGAAQILTSTVVPTAAAIQAMRTVPIQLTPQPAVGQFVIPLWTNATLTAGFTQYGGAFNVVLDVCSDLTLGSALSSVSWGALQFALNSGAAGEVATQPWITLAATEDLQTLLSGAGVILYVQNADPTGGTSSTVTFRTTYLVAAL